jgi:hypothetical protein
MKEWRVPPDDSPEGHRYPSYARWDKGKLVTVITHDLSMVEAKSLANWILDTLPERKYIITRVFDEKPDYPYIKVEPDEYKETWE